MTIKTYTVEKGGDVMGRKVIIILLGLSVCLWGIPSWAQDDAMIDIDNHVGTFTGSWGTSTARILYYGDNYRWATCSGSSSMTGEAVFSSLQVGIDVVTTSEYAVYVRWVVDPNRTTAAHYRIFDGASSIVPVGECTFNQQGRGGEWIYCDTVTLTAGNAAVVKLGNNCEAGKYVIADAVRFLKIGAGDITGVTAGTGLEGGATTGNATLSVAVPYRLPQVCNNGQIASWNGSAWVCAADQIGTIGPGAITSVHILDGTIASADVGFNYANSTSKGGPATDLSCAGCVGNTDLSDGAVTNAKISGTGASTGQVLKYSGSAVTWANDEIGNLTLPYAGWVNTDQVAFWVMNIGPAGTGIWGLGTNGIGVFGEGDGTPGYGVWGKHTGTQNQGAVGTALGGVVGVGTGNSRGVHGQSEGATGVHGQSGSGYGVYGDSTNGDAILGVEHQRGNYGIMGSLFAGAAGFGKLNSRGVHGQSEDATGVHGQSINGYGVYGESTNGIAAAFRGNVHVLSKSTGAIVLEMGEGLDYAEGFEVSDRIRIIPGTVLVIDPDNPGKLTTSNKPYDTKVAGIVAGAKGLGSGVRLGTGRFDLDVALAGRVYCNVDGAYGEISLGDLLTTSPTPGYAMVVKDHTKAQGAILGKAMEKLAEGQRGQILVLVTLQ